MSSAVHPGRRNGSASVFIHVPARRESISTTASRLARRTATETPLADAS
ncbi:hypothetical protein [Microvirga calopogonii]|nr:hypothetical protein [Microvirga calopogonii]